MAITQVAKSSELFPRRFLIGRRLISVSRKLFENTIVCVSHSCENLEKSIPLLFPLSAKKCQSLFSCLERDLMLATTSVTSFAIREKIVSNIPFISSNLLENWRQVFVSFYTVLPILGDYFLMYLLLTFTGFW
jgi:hypothetical protein